MSASSDRSSSIGSPRLDLQTKFLRALQEREIERLGGLRPLPIDVRVVAATNVNLKTAVRAREFREDLYCSFFDAMEG